MLERKGCVGIGMRPSTSIVEVQYSTPTYSPGTWVPRTTCLVLHGHRFSPLHQAFRCFTSSCESSTASTSCSGHFRQPHKSELLTTDGHPVSIKLCWRSISTVVVRCRVTTLMSSSSSSFSASLSSTTTPARRFLALLPVLINRVFAASSHSLLVSLSFG